MQLLGDSAAILQELATDPRFANTKVAFVSRTNYPEWAVPLLSLMEIEPGGRTMADVCCMELNQIYPANKRRHFTALHEASSVPLGEMIFFDNQMDNIESVSPMGVTCVYTPRGMTQAQWREGLESFRRVRHL